MRKPKALLAWSSGKDSAWALHVLRQQPGFEVVGLVTTVNERFDRVAMHAVPTALLETQAEAAGLPLWKVPIPYPCGTQQYEAAMRKVIDRACGEGVSAFAFGDLFLTDVREYRERQLAGTGLLPLFPLWMRPTGALVREMIDSGVRAVLTCVDPKRLPARFAGRELTAELLAELPPTVDPCGENGEFHSFAHAGPMFRQPIEVRVGAVVERDGFVFADVRRR
ncbi:MAG TPA: hypothetical protein VN812_11610 [Candidatus Acidoferrales bacterium]|nr:hypothetical protein [Candidatus Acidoferrales bacterium]